MTGPYETEAEPLGPRRRNRGAATPADPAILKRAVNAYQDGASAREAARQAGASLSTLLRHLNELGVPRHANKRRSTLTDPNALSPELADRIVAAYRERESVIGVAREFHVHTDRVIALLDQHGIPRRRRPLKTEITDAMKDQIVTAYEEVGSVPKVARHFRVGEVKVRGILDERGVNRSMGRPSRKRS